MRVHILGSRGSTPAPGRDFVRYGGHTSCLALAHDGEPPRLIIDAGTGIRQATALFGGKPFVGALVIGHFHWDHTQGMPFFGAGDDPGSMVRVYAPSQDGRSDIEAVLARAMSPPHFPVRPSELRGQWSFNSLEEGAYEIEGFRVLAREVPHKGGRTFGYRISDGHASIGYISDHWPTGLGPGPDGLGEYHEAALAVSEGVDVLFHDAQYTDEELPVRGYFGHSSPGYALNLAIRAGAKRLVLHHHDPWRTDEELDLLVARYLQRNIPVEAAVDGAVLDLPA